MNQETMVAIENILFRMDLIGWLDLLHGVMRHGRLHRIGWIDTSGYAVEDILRQYDIHAYGRAIRVELVPDVDSDKKRREMHRWMWVNYEQASWAEYVLLRGGLTLTTPLIDPANVRRAAQHSGLPTPWKRGKKSKPVTPVEIIFDWFSGLMR